MKTITSLLFVCSLVAMSLAQAEIPNNCDISSAGAQCQADFLGLVVRNYLPIAKFVILSTHNQGNVGKQQEITLHDVYIIIPSLFQLGNTNIESYCNGGCPGKIESAVNACGADGSQFTRQGKCS